MQNVKYALLCNVVIAILLKCLKGKMFSGWIFILAQKYRTTEFNKSWSHGNCFAFMKINKNKKRPGKERRQKEKRRKV